MQVNDSNYEGLDESTSQILPSKPGDLSQDFISKSSVPSRIAEQNNFMES